MPDAQLLVLSKWIFVFLECFCPQSGVYVILIHETLNTVPTQEDTLNRNWKKRDCHLANFYNLSILTHLYLVIHSFKNNLNF